MGTFPTKQGINLGTSPTKLDQQGINLGTSPTKLKPAGGQFGHFPTKLEPAKDQSGRFPHQIEPAGVNLTSRNFPHQLRPVQIDSLLVSITFPHQTGTSKESIWALPPPNWDQQCPQMILCWSGGRSVQINPCSAQIDSLLVPVW